MTPIELALLGVALSMDAFAVTISNLLCYRGLTRRDITAMPIAFGLFQGLMPLIGYALGRMVSDFISQFAGIVTFAILSIIGAKMIWDSLHDDEQEDGGEFTLSTLTLQAVATSIDALAVGVRFAALSVEPLSAGAIIALTTAASCTLAVLLGKRFGSVLGEKATIVGGIVLIAIGVKALLF